jgi:hypothetical protein
MNQIVDEVKKRPQSSTKSSSSHYKLRSSYIRRSMNEKQIPKKLNYTQKEEMPKP